MNKVYLIGNLTRDPETRNVGADVTVCNFSVAVNRRVRKDGEQLTDFFNVVAWRTLGDLCQRYLAKGRKVAIVGAIQTRTYEAQDGSKRTAFDIVADEVEFLTTAAQKQDNSASGNPSGYATAVSKTGSEEFTKVENEELPF